MRELTPHRSELDSSLDEFESDDTHASQRTRLGGRRQFQTSARDLGDAILLVIRPTAGAKHRAFIKLWVLWAFICRQDLAVRP